MPLFFFAPHEYLSEVRKIRAEQENDRVQPDTLILQPHRKSKSINRFTLNRLVTIQTDFKQVGEDKNQPKKIIVEAGQVGIISNITNDEYVEVLFRSLALGMLLSERLLPKHGSNTLSYWELRIKIKISFTIVF